MKYIYNSYEFNLEVSSEIKDLCVRNSDTTLLYLKEGRADIHIGEEQYSMKPEDIFIINRNCDYIFLPEKDILVCYLTINHEILSKYLQDEYIMFWCNSSVGNDEKYVALRKKLKEFLEISITLPEGKLDVRMNILFYQILEYLFNNFLITDKNKGLLSKDDERKKKIALYVENNYHRHISLNEVAEELFLTYHYLSRNFKNMFGISFNEYVNNVRLRHVVNDLLYTGKNMIEIAMDNGFTSSSVLNRVFKDVYNMTPTEFKKTIKNSKQLVEIVENSENLKVSKKNEWNRNSEDKTDETIKKYIVTADVMNMSPYNKVFNSMINIGTAADLLFSGLQEHVKLLCKELGFTYVRLWNIFHEKMDLRKGNDTNNLNFEKLDYIFDFLVENHIKPFIEFGNKPKIILNDVQVISLKELGRMETHKYKGKEEFSQLLAAFIEHIIERYGVEEVTTWKYEFWNEFIFPEYRWSEENVTFFQIFEIGYNIIKSRLPNCEVGGGGTPRDHLTESFYREWSEHTKPDFVSIMIYPYRVYNEDLAYETDADSLSKSVETVRNYLQRINMNCKLYVTEWNSTVSSRNYQNDSCYQAAYCVKNAADVLEKVDLVGFWVGSDRFTSAYDSVQPINGGSGLLTRDGIKKPAFFAFQFLNELYSYLIKIKKNTIITSDSTGNYAILCHNYKHMDYKHYMISDIQRDPQQYIPENNINENILLELNLHNVPSGHYRVSVMEMSSTKGSVLWEWKKLNFETRLHKNEIEYLKNSCTPRLIIFKETVQEDGIFNFTLNLESQAIVLLKIHKI